MNHKIRIIFSMMMAWGLLTAAGCGGGGGSGSTESPTTSSATFTIQWADAASAAKTGETAAATPAAMPDDCAARGVESFRVKANDGAGVTKATGTISCATNQGTLEGIPPGSGYTIVVSGLNSGGGEIYRGEKTGLTLAAGANNIGVIIMDLIRITFTKLPDTGQTLSYTQTFGEDNDYKINPPSYTKLDATGKPANADAWAMVRDNVTGLIWENKTDDGTLHDRDRTYDWNDAKDSFVVDLNTQKFGGYSDWRLPTVMELSSLVNAQETDPALKVSHFPDFQPSAYWSSTPYANFPDSAWLVDFNFGDVLSYTKTGTYFVVAVRG